MVLYKIWNSNHTVWLYPSPPLFQLHIVLQLCLIYAWYRPHLVTNHHLLLFLGRDFMQEYVKKRTEGNQTINYCTLCGKSNSKRYNVLNHVESAHFPNMFEYSCEYCGNVFKSQNSYKVHLSTTHKNKY